MRHFPLSKTFQGHLVFSSDIRIYNECVERIDKSVPRVFIDITRLCRVIPNSDPLDNFACVQGSTNGTLNIVQGSGTADTIPMVMPTVPLAFPMVASVSQW